MSLTLNLIWGANPKYARHEDRAIQKTVQITPPRIEAMALRRDPGEESDMHDGDQAPECGPMEFMILSGNFAGLAAVLSTLPDASNTLRVRDLVCLKDTIDNGNMPYSAIKHAFTNEDLDGRLRLSEPGSIGSEAVLFGPRTQGILDTLNAVSRWESADASCAGLWRVRMRVLTACLEAFNENGSLPDTDLVGRLLNDQGPLGGSLAQRLGAPPADIDETLRFQTDRLFLTAATVHQPIVLGLAKAWLREAPAPGAPDGVDSLTPSRLLRQCALTDRVSSAIDNDALRACLEVVQDLGLNVTGPFQDHWHDGARSADEEQTPSRSSSFLHALAASRHPQSLPALLVALEAGCDPTLRNHQQRTAASTVSPKEMKANWRSIEGSFAAKKAAEAALDGMGWMESHSPG